MPRVLLLNPPAPGIVLRDSFCSKVSKSGYLYHPVDLLAQDGILRAAGHTPLFLDAVAEGRDEAAVEAAAERARPDLVFLLAARANLAGDLSFARRLAALGHRVVIGGDIALAAGARHFTLAPRAAGFLADFTSGALARLLSGENPGRAFLAPGDTGRATPEPGGEVPFGVPGWAGIPRNRYRYPFALRRPMATLLTASGCGLGCRFCASGGYPYRFRPLGEVEAELDLLERLHYRELYIADQTFNRDPARAAELADRLARRRPGFSFSCFARLDRLDGALLDRLRRAGCHTLLVGIESGDPAQRARHGKALPAAELAGRIGEIRSRGIRVCGTFVIGLPGDSPASVESALRLATALPLDFVSFNTLVRRAGTPLGGGALPTPADQSFGAPDGPDLHPALRGGGAARLVAAANRRFYLRPAYLLRRLLGLRTLEQFKIEVSQALNMFGRKP